MSLHCFSYKKKKTKQNTRHQTYDQHKSCYLVSNLLYPALFVQGRNVTNIYWYIYLLYKDLEKTTVYMKCLHYIFTFGRKGESDLGKDGIIFWPHWSWKSSVRFVKAIIKELGKQKILYIYITQTTLHSLTWYLIILDEKYLIELICLCVNKRK